VSNTGGSAELIVDGESGIEVQPGDFEAIAQGIKSLEGDRARCKSIGWLGEREFRSTLIQKSHLSIL